MKINSHDLISRSTQSSARALVVAAAAAILVEFYELDPNNWNILNGDVTPDVYRAAILVTIAFLSGSLFVNWFGDFTLYRSWFKSQKFDLGTVWGNSDPRSC